MKLVGKNNSVFINKLLVADKFFTRIKGLLGRKNLDENEGLLITKCNSIHTFFMKFPIDVLFLKKEKENFFRVVKILENMKPFRISPFVLDADCVIELKSGKISKLNIKERDLIELKEDK